MFPLAINAHASSHIPRLQQTKDRKEDRIRARLHRFGQSITDCPLLSQSCNGDLYLVIAISIGLLGRMAMPSSSLRECMSIHVSL